MNDIRIILLCSTRFALPALKELAFFNLLAAVAIPRQYDEWMENAASILAGTNIPIIELEKESFAEQLRKAIKDKKANLGLVISFPFKIPSSVYSLPAKGFYNIHPGPLPQYRGPDPVFQQLIHQEKYAGVTIHKLDDGMDTGAVVLGERLKIEADDTYGLLSSRLALLGARLTGTLIKLVSLEFTIPSRPQAESGARYFKRQGAKEVVINWQSMHAAAIIALINACNPWNKGAITKINNQVIRLLEAESLPLHSFVQKDPGYILAIEEKGITVSTTNEEALLIRIVYTDEGFLPAYKLALLGVKTGNRFEAIP